METIKDKKKVVAWFRVSTANQETDMQKTAVYDAIKHDGHRDNDIITIEGVGASAIKVDSLYKSNINKLFNLMESGEISRIYAWALDRLGRDDKELTYLRWKLEETGVELRTLDGVTIDSTANTDTKKMQELMMTFKSFIASDEMRKKQKRMQEGKAESKAKGNLTHRAKFGYDSIPNGKRRKAVINEEEAALIRRIYRMYLKDEMPANAIGNQLKAEGLIKFKSKRGGCCKIWKVLNCEDYAGNAVYPAIVSREEYEQAQEKLKVSHKEVRYQYDENLIWYGKHILYHNGLKMHITNRDGAYKSEDDKGTLNINVVDSLLMWLASEFQNEFSIETDTIKEVLKKRIEDYRHQLTIIDDDREDIKKRQRKLNIQFDNDALTEEEYTAKITDIKTAIREVNDREHHIFTMIEDAEKELKEREQPNRFIDVYELSDARRAEVIRKIVKRIDAERGSKQGTYYFHVTLASGTKFSIFSETMKHKYYLATEPRNIFDTDNATPASFGYNGVCQIREDGVFIARHFNRTVGEQINVPWIVRLDSKTKRLRIKKMQEYHQLHQTAQVA